MARVFLSIGSNIHREHHIRLGLLRLRHDFPGCIVSSVYETPAFGFEGAPFYNLAVGLETDMDFQAMRHYCKTLELEHKRAKYSKKFTPRTLDIDILLYDDLILQPDVDLPRKEILTYNFVLFPLAEIAADVIHPEQQQSIGALVQQSTLDASTLKAIPLFDHQYNTRPYLKHWPKIHASCYIDPQCSIIGDVHIGENSSVWPATVIRGDVNSIRIGHSCNIQDGAVLHVAHANAEYTSVDGYPLTLGNQVTVGHQATLHACSIGDNCLIGMGARVLDNTTVEANTIIGAGSLVPSGKHLEGGYLWLGSPAKKARPLTDKELAFLTYSAEHYVRLTHRYTEQDHG